MNTTLHNATAEYLEAVREALGDQPSDEVAEIMDDLAEHLEQVTAEFGDEPSRAELEERLGTPRQYADELRSAAGLPKPTSPDRTRRRGATALRFVVTWLLRIGVVFAVGASLVMLADGDPNAAVGAYLIGLAPCAVAVASWLVARRSTDSVAALRELPDVRRLEDGVAALRTRPWGSATVEFIESLRPAWWLLRGWLVTQVVLLFATGQEPAFPIVPSPIAVGLLIAAVIGSVWWGRRAAAGMLRGWPRWSSNAANIALAVAAPVFILLMSTEWSSYYGGHEVVYEEVPIYDEMRFEGFFHEDGTEIINLYVYNEGGRLLEGVQIYDQDGRPVENVAPWKWHECLEEGGWFPGGPQGNVYPRPAVYYNTEPPRCAEPGQAAPFGPALPGSEAEQQVAEAEVERGTDQGSHEPEADETPLPGGRTSEPDAEIDPAGEPD